MKNLNVAMNVALLFVFSTFIYLCFTTQDEVKLATSIESNLKEYTNNDVGKAKGYHQEEKQVEYYEEPITYNYSNYKESYSVVETSHSSVPTNLGDIGRLEIPTVGYSAALYDGIPRGSAGSQQIVNNIDSAVWINIGYGATTYIGDHNYQGFENMKNSIPGVTRAYITWADGTTSSYVCVSVQYNCTKTRTCIYDESGTDIYLSGYSIAMCTCNYNSSTVTVSYWNKE